MCMAFGGFKPSVIEHGDKHVLLQLFTIEKRGHIFKRGGHHASVREAAGAEFGFEGLSGVEVHGNELRSIGGQDGGDVRSRRGGRGGVEPGSGDAVGPGKGHEIGETHTTVRPFPDKAIEEILLSGADGLVAAVAEDEDFYRETVVDDGGEFLEVHHDTAIASKTDGLSIGRGNGGTNGRGKIVAHGSTAGVAEKALAILEITGLEGSDASGGITAGKNGVSTSRGKEEFDEVVLVNAAGGRLAVAWEDVGETTDAFAAPGEPFDMRGQRCVHGGQFFEKEVEEGAGVGMDRLRGAEGGLGKFGSVDIHLDGMCSAGEALPVVADLADAKATADDQQQVGVLDGKITGAGANGALSPAKKRMVARDKVMSPGRGNRDVETFGELTELRDSASETDAGAAEKDRTTSLKEAASNIACVIAQDSGVTGLCGSNDSGIPGRVVGKERFRIDERSLDVDRYVEPAGTGASVGGEMEGAFEVITDRFGFGDNVCVFGDAADHRHDIGFLVTQLAKASGEIVRAQEGFSFHLAGENENGDRIRPRAKDAVDGVDAAGAAGHAGDTDFVGDAGVSLGRHGGSLFVMVADVAEARFASECVIKMHGSATRNNKDIAYVVIRECAEYVVGNADDGWNIHKNRPGWV